MGTSATIVNGFASPRFSLVTQIGQLRPSLKGVGSWRVFRTRHSTVYDEIEAACAVNMRAGLWTRIERASVKFLYFAN